MGKKEFDAELEKRFGKDFTTDCPKCGGELTECPHCREFFCLGCDEPKEKEG
jgi:hypothetical protein